MRNPMRQKVGRVKCAGPGCSTRFTPIPAIKVYCSKICKARAHWRRKHPRTFETERTCKRPECGNTFRPRLPHQVFCSERCQILVATRHRTSHRHAGYSWKVPRVCARLGCGVTFTPTRSRTICCSKKCRNWLYHGTIEPPERVCARPNCGVSFRPRVGIPNRLYCSASCERRLNQPKRLKRYIAKLVEAQLTQGNWHKAGGSAPQPAKPRPRGHPSGPDEFTKKRIALAARLTCDGLSLFAMKKQLFPEQSDAALAYANVKKLFRRYRKEIEMEKQHLAPPPGVSGIRVQQIS